MDKKAKAFVFINGKLEMHRILNIDEWIDKDLKPKKKEYKVHYPTSITPSGFVDISFTPAHVSLFSARSGRGVYLVISLFNPIFTKVETYPLTTLAAASNPKNLAVPYA